jgi:6-phosphogluconolactonase
VTSVTVPEVFIAGDEHVLYQAIAARLVTRLVDLQASQTRTHLLVGEDLTDPGVVRGLAAALTASPARDAVDWEGLDVWWAAERMVTDPADRVDAPAADLPLALARQHPIGRTGQPDDAGRAAETYAQELAEACGPEDREGVPTFDLALLALGASGGLAGLAPEQAAVYDERAVVAVPAARPGSAAVTLTLSALRSAREVWFVAAGASRSTAVRLAVGEAGAMQVPAAGVRGSHRTLVLVDRAAAERLPHVLGRIASP